MSNDCCGTLRCVSKRKETLDRMLKILKYEDPEYCLYRCKDASAATEPFELDGLWVQDFYVDGAWSCRPFFDRGDNPDEKVVLGYEKNADGRDDFDRKIYGTAHFTDLRTLCQRLDFGCELFSTEPGNCFEEHAFCDRNGEWDCETGSYELDYPKDEDGEDDLDSDPEVIHGLELFGEFSSVADIYESA